MESGQRAQLSDHHGSEKQLLAAHFRQPVAYRLMLATAVELCKSAESQRLCATEMATRGKTVFVPAIITRVRKLYRCQDIIVRQSLTDPLNQA